MLLRTLLLEKKINKEFKKITKSLQELSKVNWDMYLFCPENGIESVSEKLKE